ncbi:MAG: type II toxin-antitoxin system RelE/ParE family toxin [Nostoc sp.]|uniref:type II toxin-antitoxin system RelE family toxin n=1 Tax=Nostoc sp. TaxID=1180 RepID=UPI002FF32024
MQQRLAQKLEELALNPRPEDAHLLKDRLYKVRLDQYRIIYQIQETLTTNSDKDCTSLRLLKLIWKSDRLYATQSQPK